jgi:hypothetical protein
MFSKRITFPAAAVAAAAVTAIAAPAAGAAPVVTQATGGSAEIQAAVDSFRSSLGANNAGGPAQASGRREINWDGVPDDRSTPSFMPEGQFRARGALFSTPGLGVQVSADDNDDNGNPDADPDLIQFSNINPTYEGEFIAFSTERLFAPIGSNVTNTRFVVPASDTQAQTNGFGVVFTDVDQAGSTKIELLDSEGASLGTWPVPANPGSESLSFLGIKLDPGVGAASAKITTGTAALVAPPGPSPADGPADIVVMDDFIYGEPQAVPAAQPDVRGPQLTLAGVPDELELRDLKRGLKLKLETDEPATVDASLRAKARSVEFAKASVMLAERSLGLGEGERKLTLRPKRGALRGADSLKAELRVTAVDASGNRTKVKRKLIVG